MNRLLITVSTACVLWLAAWAQERPYELTLQSSGWFFSHPIGPEITSKPTNSGGFLVGFRFNTLRWFAIGADYEAFKNTYKYLRTATEFTSVNASTHSIKGYGVFKLPSPIIVRPYAMIGAGMMIIELHGNSLNDQTRAAFMYGGGFDVPLVRRVSLRCEYRGLFYHVPDFKVDTLHVGARIHAVAPSVGLAITF